MARGMLRLLPIIRRVFGRLFGKRKPAQTADCVWRSDAARLRGVCREAGEFAAEGVSSVLVVALSAAALDRFEAALADYAPLRATSVFERDALRERLGRAGTVSVALPGALAPEASPVADARVEILVAGRHDRRVADDAIVRFAESIAGAGFVTFHLSLDDPLLAAHVGDLGPMLDKLGMTDDEPISHAFVSRAIEKAQGA
jgi:preprotein translocase subunit SecA